MPELTLKDLRFHSCHTGPTAECAACGSTVKYGSLSATAIIVLHVPTLPPSAAQWKKARMGAKMEVTSLETHWGHTLCAHCRSLPQEQIARNILNHALREILSPPVHGGTKGGHISSETPEGSAPLSPLCGERGRGIGVTAFQQALFTALESEKLTAAHEA